jgi:hypothetical protein
MSLESSTLTVTPFNMLPIEQNRHLKGQTATPEEIKKEQEEIRSKIVNRINDELERDEGAIALVRFSFIISRASLYPCLQDEKAWF